MAGPIGADMPAATIIVAGNDPLRDEALAYAERLQAAGVQTALHAYPGAIHGFASLVGLVPVANEAVSAAAKALRAGLGDGMGAR
jgi:acetyl esterase